MPTSSGNNQRGLTLFELLITLAILSLVAGMSTIWVAGSLPGLTVKSALHQLETDLKQARLRARVSGTDVSVTGQQNGYTIDTLGVTREWSRGVRGDWQLAQGLVLRAQGNGSGGTIFITKGEADGRVTIDPYTGKISSE